MNNQFKISEKKILIYGAGFNGVKAKFLFEKEKQPILGFIDERADEIEHLQGLPCFSLSELKDFVCDEYCIIITVKNVFEHSLIANNLIEMGFFNLIYKPYEILSGKSDRLLQKISEVYDSLFDENVVPQTFIPASTKPFIQKLEEPAVKYDEQNTLVSFVPVELLFSNFYSHKSNWSELNFASFYPNTSLFSAFNGMCDFSSSCEDYFQYGFDGVESQGINITERTKKNVLKGRFSVFNEMKHLYETDRNFFIEHCPKVEYRKNKFILVSSGKNRVSFQVAMGLRLIPVKMEKKDYDAWFNRKVLNEIEKKLHELNINNLFAPIPHPCFYKYPYIAGNYWNIWAYPLARYLTSEIYHTTLKNKYDDFSILDISLDHGNISRYFSNIGFNVKRFSTEKKKQDLEKEFDVLLNCPIESDNSLKNPWAITLDTRNLQKEVIEYLKITDVKFLCILSWEDNIEYLPQEKYYKKIKIFDIVWNGKKVQGFILRKEK